MGSLGIHAVVDGDQPSIFKGMDEKVNDQLIQRVRGVIGHL
jgi:hypothetical protein